MPRRWMVGLLGAALAVSAVSSAPAAAPVSIEAARTELLGLITDVTQATAYQYKITDDQGRHIGPLDVVWVPEAGRKPRRTS